DFIAVAIEEGDGELGFLQPIVVGGFTEGGDRERQQDHQAAAAQGETFRQRFDETPAPPASDMEAVPQHCEALLKLGPPVLGLVHPESDARVELEQEAGQPYLPAHPIVALEGVAQRFPQGRSITPAGRSRPAVTASLNRSRGSKLWRDGQKMNANTQAMPAWMPIPPPARRACGEALPHEH